MTHSEKQKKENCTNCKYCHISPVFQDWCGIKYREIKWLNDAENTICDEYKENELLKLNHAL